MTPLSKAKRSGNNKTINVILKYMSEIPRDTSTLIKQIFPFLLEFESFHEYLAMIPIQTSEMLKKQTIVVEEPMSKSIISLSDSPTRYVDNLWFKNYMGDKSDQQQEKNLDITPVNVKGMNIRWFIREKHGKEFLQEILNSDDLSLFKIVTIQMLVEYFYLKYKKFLFTNDLPLFATKTIFYYLQLISSEILPFDEKKQNHSYILIQWITLTAQLVLQLNTCYISLKQYRLDPGQGSRR